MTGLFIPSAVNAAKVYVDGGKMHVGIAEVGLPEVKNTTAELEGFDVGGKLEEPIVGHTYQLDLTLKFMSLNTTIDYVNNQDVHTIQVRASHQFVDPATGKNVFIGVKVDARGKIKEFKPGTIKTGEKTDAELVMSCQYYKVEMGGTEMVHIDKLNLIGSVEGIDLMSTIKNLIT